MLFGCINSVDICGSLIVLILMIGNLGLLAVSRFLVFCVFTCFLVTVLGCYADVGFAGGYGAMLMVEVFCVVLMGIWFGFLGFGSWCFWVVVLFGGWLGFRCLVY